jgi:hypothetical protein
VTYVAQHAVATWGGTMGDTDIWSVRLNIADGIITTFTPALFDAWAHDTVDDLLGLFATMFAQVPMGNSAAVLDYCKLAFVNELGAYVDGSDAVLSTPGAGVRGGGNPCPPENAIVVSLLTDVSRGHAHAGRMYLPAGQGPGNSLNSGRLVAAYAVQVRDWFHTFIEGVRTATGPALTGIGIPCVMSNIGAGVTRPITGIKVGDVADTMRSRRNRLVENYTAVTAL